MTKPSAELSTIEWVALKDRELRARGCDPTERFLHTGHSRPVSRAYLATIGNWGRMTTREMCDPDNPERSLARVKLGAFRQFRWHHGLMSKREFEGFYGPHRGRPWLLGHLCWEAHSASQRSEEPRIMWPISIGEACARAVQARQSPLSPLPPLGLLPVEVVLYTRHFDRFVRHLPVLGLITYDEWCEASDANKTAYWNLGEGAEGAPWGDISSPGPHLVASREAASFRPKPTRKLHRPGGAARAAG